MTEQWRPVIDWEGFYSVSDLGRVRSEARVISLCDGRTRRIHQKILNPTQSPVTKRMNLVLCNGPEQRVSVTVDRLVMDAFVGPRPEGLERLHWDDDPANNALSNLRYGTQSENQYDAVRNGRHACANRQHCPQKHPYDEANTYVYRGRRNCRTCARERWVPETPAQRALRTERQRARRAKAKAQVTA